MPLRTPAALRSRTALDRRGAAALAVAAGVFALLQAALSLALHLDERGARDAAYVCRMRVFEAFEREHGPADALVVGSSRTWMGLRPEIVSAELPDAPAIFNFSKAAAGPFHELLWLRRLLEEDGARREWLILEISPFQLAENGRLRMEDDLIEVAALRSSDWPLVRRHSERHRRLALRWWRARWVPAWSERETVLTAWTPALATHRERRERDECPSVMGGRGWRPNPWGAHMPEAYRRRVERDAALWAAAYADLRFGERGPRMLREILALCAKHRVAVTFVVMPEPAELDRWYGAESRRRVDGFLGELSSETGVPLVDARRWARSEDFTDTSHLTEPGAEHFSRRLGEELARLSSRSAVPRVPDATARSAR